MCYPKPGPRCSAHTAKALAKANAAVEAALDAGDQDAYIRAREDADRAQDAYDRTPEGIRALRDSGDLEAAAQYEREREHAIKAYTASKALLESGGATIHKALYNHGVSTVRRYDSNFGGLVYEDVTVTRGADGVAEVRFTYQDVLDADSAYAMVDNGTLALNDFTNAATLDADLAEHASNANDAYLSDADTEEIEVRECAVLDHVTGVNDAERYVRVSRTIKGGVSTEMVREHMEAFLSRSVSDADEDDLRSIIAHPLASAETRREAQEYLDDLAA